MRLTEEWLAAIDDEAQARRAMKAGSASHRPLSDGYEFVGLVGEAQFACEFNVPLLNWERKPQGDKGIDFIVPLRFTLDVKTARKAHNLLVEQGKVNADIYVLAAYSDDTRQARMLGWEFGPVVLLAPVRDFGAGILNHYIAREELHPMDELRALIMRLT